MEKVENQVVFLGRETHEKGIDILKNAEPQIHGKVVYCDNLPWEEAMKILKSSQVLVVPSRRDSLPTVIKEAFYLKVPVVGTNVDGIPELIQDNNNGLLVPSENAQKLAEAVNSLLDDKPRSKKFADAGYKFVKKKLTWDVVLPRFIKFYENLLH
jgi:glycosyltransferase involved in cell wall biosynthesis